MEEIKNYFRNKPHRIMGLLAHLLNGFGILCTVFFSNFPISVKSVAVIIYFIMVFLTLIWTIRANKPGVMDIVPSIPSNVIDYAKNNGQSQPPTVIVIPGQDLIHEGILHTHQNKTSNYSEIINRIKLAKHSIKIITYYGDNLLKGTKKEIIEAMNRSVDVQMLIAKKGSVMLDEVWELEGKKQDTRIDITREIISEIKQITAEHAFRLQYREYNTQARYAVIIIDGKWAWWTPYHPGINVENTTTIVLTDTRKESIIWNCINHFDRLWFKLEKGNATVPDIEKVNNAS